MKERDMMGIISSLTFMQKIGIAALVLMVAFTTGYMVGRQDGREASLKAAVKAYQQREKINDKVQNMDGVSLCVALGGMQSECDNLLRGLDKTAKGQ